MCVGCDLGVEGWYVCNIAAVPAPGWPAVALHARGGAARKISRRLVMAAATRIGGESMAAEENRNGLGSGRKCGVV
jgi:hypothetical protein